MHVYSFIRVISEPFFDNFLWNLCQPNFGRFRLNFGHLGQNYCQIQPVDRFQNFHCTKTTPIRF
jgi:hypothetical protein